MTPQPLLVDNALDFLKATYRQGRLVPFIGSGLSARAVPSWPDLIQRLGELVGEPVGAIDQRTSDQKLVTAAERILAKLRGKDQRVGDLLRAALGTHAATEATKALASTWWPLVLTTNYDGMFLNAFNADPQRETTAMTVLGRSRTDCQKVVASLTAPMAPVLWALQGLLSDGSKLDLQREIVLGYDQYREATFANADFRAAFVEVYRNRSLLFIGTGLREDYFRGLFGEALTRLGPAHHAHCALVNKRDVDSGEIDPWFLHTRFNIVVLMYEDLDDEKFSGFAPALTKIATELNSTFGCRNRISLSGRTAIPLTIELNDDRLTEPDSDAEEDKTWLVFSAGRKEITGEPHLSREAREILGDAPVTSKLGEDTESGGMVHRVHGRQMLLAVARSADLTVTSRKARDLRPVAEVTAKALKEAEKEGATAVAFMFIAASTTLGRWPRVFSLIQMLRGIKQFARQASPKSLLKKIAIHDTAAAVRRDISAIHAVKSGKLDPDEVLECEAVRFFIELEDDSGIRRTPTYVREDKLITDVADYLFLGDAWVAYVEPDPYERQDPLRATSTETLTDAGIVPGSTLRFRLEPPLSNKPSP